MPHDNLPAPSPPAAALEALDARLAVVSRNPLNAETRLHQHPGLLTPNRAFYKRNHFSVPALSIAGWRLEVAGLVERPAVFTYNELRTLPSRTLLVTLECAGNGRSGFQPPVEGEPWRYGAVSTAEWTGIPLSYLLDAASVAPAACEIVVIGADSGHVPAAGAILSYARSLPVAHAVDGDALLAYAMNGEPLAPEHGFPVRLVVPGWYGMAAVKWVIRIEAVAAPFRGFYQAERYVMPAASSDETPSVPLTTVAVRSLITFPAEGTVLPAGTHVVRGFAWSGEAPIARVEVSLDGGLAWQPATLTSEASRYAWRRWEYVWHAATPSSVTLHSRAADVAGNTQPAVPAWNRLGYANNAVQSVRVTIR
jgi:DMSO/TMAO reductase YedYZ molybdopterin-dependent catalytic subunit